MVGLLDLRGWETILEPSAGKGALINAIHDRYVYIKIVAYELNVDNFCELHRNYGSFDRVVLHKSDFLRSQDDEFDRVVMNPPVKSSLRHVEHAMSMVVPGGRLVALLHSHVAKEIKNTHGAREYRIAGGTFSIDNQEVDASLIVWDKDA